MMRRRAFALALACSALASGARADALSDLVDRYVAWRGGPAFERLQTLHQSGAIDTAGLHGTFDSWMSRDSRQWLHVDLGVLKQTQAFAPDRSWSLNPSGQVETPATITIEATRRAGLIAFADALYGRGGAKAVLAAPQSRDGRTWSVVRVSFGDEDVYDILIDPKTGELDGYSITADRKPSFQGFGDWRMVDGVRVPFLQTETIPAAPAADTTMKLASVELDRPLPPELMARPAGAHRADFVNGAAATDWIAFDFFDQSRIYIPAKVNGRETTVLLDSGADVSAIDNAFAAALGLKPQGGLAAAGAGGVDTAGLLNGVNVELPGLTLHGLTAIALDFKPIADRIGHPLPFVLGADVFNETAIEIDFASRRIRFHALKGLQVPPGAVEIALPKILGNRAVPVSVEGRPPVPFDLDLGNGSPLAVFPAYYKAQKLLDGRRTTQALGGAVGGVHPETIATLHDIGFGGVTFHDVPTAFTADTVSAMNSEKTSGNIGLPILSRFRLLIDFTHDRLYAWPYPDAAAAGFAKDRLGLSLRPEAQDLVVEFVSPGGPAEAAGFKAGDRIRLVDGQPAQAWTVQRLRALAAATAGGTVVFTLADGAVRRVTRTDFY
jgi:hypothetical protein